MTDALSPKQTLRLVYKDYSLAIQNIPKLKTLPKNPDHKGKKDQNCNREVCQKTGANWFNLSTRSYYCFECAQLINEANMNESMKLWEHPFLCLSPFDTEHTASES